MVTEGTEDAQSVTEDGIRRMKRASMLRELRSAEKVGWVASKARRPAAREGEDRGGARGRAEAGARGIQAGGRAGALRGAGDVFGGALRTLRGVAAAVV